MNLREILNRSNGDSFVIVIKRVSKVGSKFDPNSAGTVIAEFDLNMLTGEYRQYKNYPFEIGDDDINKYLDKYYDAYFHVVDEGGRKMVLAYECGDQEVLEDWL